MACRNAETSRIPNAVTEKKLDSNLLKSDKKIIGTDGTNKNGKKEIVKQDNTKEENEAKVKTIDNIMNTYKNEVTAHAKYIDYAQKAEAEGFHPIAILYKAVSISENIQAQNNKLVLEASNVKAPTITPIYEVKTTKRNLEDDVYGEAQKANMIYSTYLKTAGEANNQMAYISICYVKETVKKHKVFYEKALENMNSNTVLSMPTVYYVCPICGNTYESTAPKYCDFSLTSRDKFIKITNIKFPQE